MDAGLRHVVEVGQYFMNEDTEEQFFARACREYILPVKSTSPLFRKMTTKTVRIQHGQHER